MTIEGADEAALVRERLGWRRSIERSLAPGVVVHDPEDADAPWATWLDPVRSAGDTAAVLYLPGRWGSPHLWAVVEPDRDLRVALALQGVPSITVRYPTSATPDDKAGISILCTSDLLAAIVAAVAVAIRLFRPRPLVMCGYSMGASLAFLAGGLLPTAGVVALDGGLPNERLPSYGFDGCLQHPFRHPRAVRSALARLARTGSERSDIDRWRLAHERWWPARQVAEVRSGNYAGRIDAGWRLRAITCPILTISAGDRDPTSDLRAERSARLTRSAVVRQLFLDGWTHDQVGASSGSDQTVVTAVQQFLADVASGRLR
jgi:pimeloyl-ACP methyl ester carboxylesterase